MKRAVTMSALNVDFDLAQPERINVNEVLFRPTDQRDW